MEKKESLMKWLIAATIIANVLLFASNMVWLWQWCQYDYVEETTTVTVDAADGIASYIGRDGNVYGNGHGNDEEKVPDEGREQGYEDEEIDEGQAADAA